MSNIIKIKKGLNIKLKGTADRVLVHLQDPSLNYSIKPTDFHGLVPKLLVNENDTVQAGTPLFYDKYNPKIVFVSPVSGRISTIRRGEKRKLLAVDIQGDKAINYKFFEKQDPLKLTAEEVKNTLLESGCWPFIRQRPYGIIANPDDTPKYIVVSAFDNAPLAPDNDFIVNGQAEAFQTGLNALTKLTTGKVHLNVHEQLTKSETFLKAKNVQINTFAGPHPSSTVGVQIHHINPINKGERVWTVTVQDVLVIGKLFLKGRFDAERIVALAGPYVTKPRYYKALLGTKIADIVKNNIDKEQLLRFISGNVLTGQKVNLDDALGYYDVLVSVIKEGNQPEFMGWLAPGFNKFSISRTFPSWLTPNKEYDIDTNLHGEERAFVVSGQYESVLPMDIYPVHLLKAVMAGDIELMEKLGIYEVTEEELALCEFVCTSKIPVQAILREGLDLVKKECN